MNTDPDEVDRILDDPALGVRAKEQGIAAWLQARILMSANPNGYRLQVRKADHHSCSPHFPWRAKVLRRGHPVWADTYPTQPQALEAGFRVLKSFLS